MQGEMRATHRLQMGCGSLQHTVRYETERMKIVPVLFFQISYVTNLMFSESHINSFLIWITLMCKVSVSFAVAYINSVPRCFYLFVFKKSYVKTKPLYCPRGGWVKFDYWHLSQHHESVKIRSLKMNRT